MRGAGLVAKVIHRKETRYGGRPFLRLKIDIGELKSQYADIEAQNCAIQTGDRVWWTTKRLYWLPPCPFRGPMEFFLYDLLVYS